MIAPQVLVKPVFAKLVHSAAYEGPCRVGRKEDLEPEAERLNGRERFEQFVNELRANLGPHASLLEPVYIEWGDNFIIPDTELDKLEPDVHSADLILMASSGLEQYPAITVARRFQRPLGTIGWISSVDITANLRSRGMEAYAFLDYDDLNHLLRLLAVRKAFRRMRMLIAAEGNASVPTGVVSSVYDLEGLKERYGVDYVCVSALDLVKGMDTLDDGALEQAEAITDRLVRNADRVHMTRDDVLRSVRFYAAVKQALAAYQSNAFVIPCFEICAKRVLDERRATFCLAHSLLKDEGIPSACEADTNVLMAIALLMYLSDKSVYMGNSHLIDRASNIIGIHHDVAGLKMKGIEGPDLPYEIRNFTFEGWGATLRYDFSRDLGEPVTMARFDPAGKKVLAVRGEIAGCAGFDRVGCALRAHIKVRDIVALHRHEMDFGHHLAMAYGDYMEDINRLAELMGFEVVEC